MTYEYSYDTYGALLNIDKKNDPQNILEKNPFRCRGYYYNTETGWYYLNSRYYDPMVKRFVSRDSAVLLTNNYENAMQYNLFMYCEGDPINGIDEDGHLTITNEQLRTGAMIATIAIVVVGIAVLTGEIGGGPAALALSSASSSIISGASVAASAAAVSPGAIAAGLIHLRSILG